MPKARAGESTRGGLTPSLKGGLGDLPRENFQIQDVGRSDSEAIFACETRLIAQTLHDPVFNLFRTPPPKYEPLFRPLDRSYLQRLKLFKGAMTFSVCECPWFLEK